MIKIGDFARLFDISIKTVRFYEQKGLLKPYYIDVYSGYRYYNEKNIEDMTVILNLKDLGFTLEEIRNYKEEDLIEKIEEYNEQIQKINRKIHILKTFSEQKGSVLKMKKFISDDRVVGKWRLLGIASNQENALKQSFIEDDFDMKELYFLPEGESYWVLSWTKGILYINDIENKYEIKDNILYISITDIVDKKESKIAVYENVDHKKYDRAQIRKKDNVQLPFVMDSKVCGFWKVVDYVQNVEQFTPNKRFFNSGELWLKKIIIGPSGDGYMITSDDKRDFTYTKGIFFEFCQPFTAAKYIYRKYQDKEYLIVEWKNGDYSYSGIVPGYYCFEKEV